MKTLIIFLFAFLAMGCDNAGKPIAQNANVTPPAAASPEKPQTAIAHTTENQPQKPTASSGEKSKWTQSGDPIDTKALDAGVTAAEKALSAKPADETAKKALADAYFKRAEALTAARQYASALGDYRRTLKYDPSNEEAKGWIDNIVAIYSSINRDSPKEGEEPPPLPFKK